MEKIINDRVDELLKEMEKHFKEAAEKNNELNQELDKKVRKLMDAHDAKKEVKRYVKIKDFADFIALAISMPLEDETKERIIAELVKECEKDGTKV